MSTQEKLAQALRETDLRGMTEAFARVIWAHAHGHTPSHNPIDADAQIALRVLRGLLPGLEALASAEKAEPGRVWRVDLDESALYLGEKRIAQLEHDPDNDAWREAMQLGQSMVEALNGAALASAEKSQAQNLVRAAVVRNRLRHKDATALYLSPEEMSALVTLASAEKAQS